MNLENAGRYPPVQVLMPNSPESRIRIGKTKKNRYAIMKESWAELKLRIQECDHNTEIEIFEHLRNALAFYNPNFQFGNFNILQDLCFFISNQDCENFCLKQLLLGIIEIAEEIPKQFPNPIKLLSQNESSFVKISKNQAACLLANAFLCAFPKRDAGLDNSGRFANYPRINFNELYDDTCNSGDGQSWRDRARLAKIEKLKCLMNYFKRCIERRVLCPFDEESFILFERKVLRPDEFIDWGCCNQPIGTLEAFCVGAIEDAEGRLQVDFANAFVGGGTLGNGSSMEEIRFITCPELIVSQLFTECLADNEALIIQGKFEQFSTYSGYGSSFQFNGDHEQDVVNLTHQLVVLDALCFPRNSQSIQYDKENLDRELHKCLVGFSSKNGGQVESNEIPIVASGKWGSGVYNGDPELKSVLQWMATSVANKDLELYTFGDMDLAHKINDLGLLARDHEITVGFIYKTLEKFGKIPKKRDRNKRLINRGLIHFLIREVVPKKLNRKLEYSSSSGDDENVTRTRNVQPKLVQPPQVTGSQNLMEISSPNSGLIPAETSHSDCWISNILCRLQTIPKSVSSLVVKIPGWNCLACELQSFVWPKLATLIKPAFRLILKVLIWGCKKIKMIYGNIQAASHPMVDDDEKEQLDLSDSE